MSKEMIRLANECLKEAAKDVIKANHHGEFIIESGLCSIDIFPSEVGVLARCDFWEASPDIDHARKAINATLKSLERAEKVLNRANKEFSRKSPSLME